jgi:hypothetical protein
MHTHTYIKLVQFQASQGKKLVRFYLKNKARVVVHTNNPSYEGSREIMVQSQMDKSMRPCHTKQIKTAKMTRGCSSEPPCLASERL